MTRPLVRRTLCLLLGCALGLTPGFSRALADDLSSAPSIPKDAVIPPEEVDLYADALEPLAPEESSRLRATGHASVEMVGNMASFYFSVGLSTMWKCFQTRDPDYCKTYLESLKSPAGYISLSVFAATAKLSTQGTLRVLGTRAASREIAGFMGLAAGSMASEIVGELFRNPHMKEYRDARSIADPVERKKKEYAALHALWSETFGSAQWYAGNVPYISSMILASVASDLTWRAGEKLLARVRPPGAKARCLMNALQADLDKTPKGKVIRFAKRRTVDVGRLLVFLSWSAVLNRPTQSIWDRFTEDRRFAKAREGLPGVLRAYASRPTDENLKAARDALRGYAELWDKQRRKKMSPLEQILAMHMEELDRFDKTIGKPYLFYSWFVDGSRESGTSWEALKKVYYTEKTSPETIVKDSGKYLRAFFCGTAPKDAFRDSKDLHGIPIPGRMNVSLDPYRVTAQADPAVCRKSLDELRAMFKTHDYNRDLLKAHATVQVSASPARIGRLRFYESRIQALSGDALEKGALPSFDAELGELRALSAELAETALGPELQRQIARVEGNRQAARQLLDYVSAPPDQRIPPEVDALAYLGLLDTKSASPEDQASERITQYFNGFVLR